MADSVVSIIMDTTDSKRKKRQKAITDVSPNATDNQLRVFANAINALSLDTLDKVTRVERKDITTAEPDPEPPRYKILAPDLIPMTMSEHTMYEIKTITIPLIMFDTQEKISVPGDDLNPVTWTLTTGAGYDPQKITIDRLSITYPIFELNITVKADEYQEFIIHVTAKYPNMRPGEQTYTKDITVIVAKDGGDIDG